MRADAERNRERLLGAAAAAFAEAGLEASVADIARRAGVGQGTVFRRFPSKADLMAEIVLDRLGEMQARAAAALAAPEPWPALCGFMEAAAELQAGDRGFFQAASVPETLATMTAGAAPETRERLAAAHAEVLETVGELLDRAQAAGEVRPDLAATDIPCLICASVQAAAPLAAAEPGLWRRYLALSLAGIRAGGAVTPLPAGAPTAEQFRAALLG